MSRLDALIKEYCPNGVTYDELGNLGKFYGGLSGKTKEDFSNGNSKFITYMNVFANPSLIINTEEKVFISENEKQNTIIYGDIIFTGSSENKEECGMSSVLTEKIDEKLYLNSFSFGFRFDNHNLLLPEFSKHLFRSQELRKQINKTASGVTRFNVSKKKMEKVLIPLPPAPVQAEIVRILDNFTELTTELTAELTARKEQCEYYKEQLFDMNIKNTDYLCLGDERLGKFTRGGGLQKKDFTDTGVGCIHYGQIYTYYGTYTNKTKTFISEEFAKKAKMAKCGDLVIATTSENDEDVCKAVAWLGNEKIAVSSDACFYTHNMHPKYVSYFFQTEQFQRQKRPLITGTKVRRVNADNIAKIKIPVPFLNNSEESYAEQHRIVNILDRFDTLCNDISVGLPAEIKAREEQYEHYRNELLTFKEKEV